jgi:Beta-ketoacyl synthase, N-terminal domain
MPRIQVEKWSFWSPESPDPAGWAKYWQNADAKRLAGDPDVAAIPAMQRRRMSRLSRMALAAALDVIPGETIDYSIFCSQHGEIVRTSALLLSMTQGIELSPTAFAQSVHNTASGLFTVIAKSKAPSSSIASGANTFAYGWMDAQAYLARNPNDRVLLVDFDEVIPDEYQTYSDQLISDHALGLVLRVADNGGVQVVRAPPGRDERLPQGPLFLAWQQSDAATLSLTTEGQGWRWDR